MSKQSIANKINADVKKEMTLRGVRCWRNSQVRVPGRNFTGETGGSDVIGFTTTPLRLFNKTFPDGVFFACEGKGPGDHLSEDQKDFLNAVRCAGGVALVAEADETGYITYHEFDLEKYPMKDKNKFGRNKKVT